MMNNYEHIMQGGVDALMEWHEKKICSKCAYYVKGKYACEDKYCDDGFREWLLQEHKEPDSWEKLLEDLDRVSKARALYAYYESRESDDFFVDIPLTFEDIAKRIRDLLEAEK